MPPMNKKTLLPLAFVPLAATNLQAQSNMQIEHADKRPNIILFMVDDMGWQDTSVPFWEKETPYNKMFETPNMERLAAQVSKNSRDIASIQAENEDLKERVERLEQLVNKLIEEKSGK